MGVDEARQDQPPAVVLARPVLARRLGLDGDDAPILDQQPVVRAEAHRRAVHIAQGRQAGEVQQIAAQGPPGHALTPSLARPGVSAARPAGTLPVRARAVSRTCSRSQRWAEEAWVRSCQSW